MLAKEQNSYAQNNSRLYFTQMKSQDDRVRRDFRFLEDGGEGGGQTGNNRTGGRRSRGKAQTHESVLRWEIETQRNAVTG